MSSWLVVWLVIFLVSTAALLACLAFLAYHGVLLVRTARRVQEEMAPLTEELSRLARTSSDRVARLQPPTRSGSRRGRG